MQLPRVTPPIRIASRLLYEADHTCCVCRKKRFDVQIHHMAGHHDVKPANLIVLCLQCHSDATKKGGLGRQFSPEELARHKASWTREVARRRRAVPTLNHSFVLFEIRRLVYQFRALERNSKTEPRALEIMRMVQQFARDFRKDIRELCVQFTYDTVNWLYWKSVSADFVYQQTAILLECIPPGLDFVAPIKRKLTKSEMQLLEHCVDVAGEIAYATCKYVRTKDTTEMAVIMLHDFLLIANINHLAGLKEQALGEFDECERISKERLNYGHAFDDGLELVKEWKETALSHPYVK